jgi:hypothetical protein
MDGACGMYRAEEKCTWRLSGEMWVKENTSQT